MLTKGYFYLDGPHWSGSDGGDWDDDNDDDDDCDDGDGHDEDRQDDGDDDDGSPVTIFVFMKEELLKVSVLQSNSIYSEPID